MSKIEKISLDLIDSFKNHPFQVNRDDSLYELADSINKNGLLNPLIVRKKGARYELISGHRRKLALELLGIDKTDVYVKELSDEEAVVYMVDSNMQREYILPSEKAFAYKMKLEALNHQGKKTSTQSVSKLTTSELIGKEYGKSREQVRRYVRLTYLIPELLKIVDDSFDRNNKKFLTLGITTAAELSYLSIDEQNLLYNTILYEEATPSYAQAKRIRELSKKKKLDFNSLEKILETKKGNQNDKITFNKHKIESVLPIDMLQRDKRYIEEYIVEAIKSYKKLKKETVTYD